MLVGRYINKYWRFLAVICLGFGLSLMPLLEVFAQSNPNPYMPDPILTVGTMIEGQGGNFNVAMPNTPHYSIRSWHLTIRSTDGMYFYSDYAQGDFPNGVLSVLPPSIPWDGRTSEYSTAGSFVPFPPGTYNVTFTVEYGDSLGFWGQGVAMTTFDIEGIAPTPTPTPTPTSTPTPTPDPLATLHPVLLIHGLIGYPDTWTDVANNNDYVSLLKSWGYPDDYISLYHYTGTGVGKDGYNNQGDIPVMAAGMANAVNQLSQLSLSDGGDGQVDIICHSMGGLIAREYLKEHPTDHHIDKVISMGTPYQGSYWMGIDNDFGPFEGFANSLAQQYLVPSVGFPVNLNNPAEQEMIPGSSELSSLNDISTDPAIKYYTIYGSIDLNFTQSIFDFKLSHTVDMGDLVVSTGSSTTVSPIQTSTKQGFHESQPVDVNLLLQKQNNKYGIVAEFESLEKLKYFHINMTRQPDVQGVVHEDLLAK